MLRALSGLKRKMFCALLIVGLLVPALPMTAMALGDETKTIAENLNYDMARFGTLLAATSTAGLIDDLGDPAFGPVTLFAPTNAAFNALPAGTLDALLADTDALADVLLYHLLDGEVFAAGLPASGSSTTVETKNGKRILIAVDGSDVTINGVAMVIETDHRASNGVIHVIDAVLECQTIAEIAAADGRFETLLAAAGIAGLDGALADPDYGPVTLFAPTDEAFAALEAELGEDAWDALLADKDALANVLLYHLLDGEVYADELPASGSSNTVETLNGQEILIEVDADGVTINGVAMVIKADIPACNGVIHVIDTVLVPEGEEAPPVPEAVVAPGLPTTGIGPDQSLPWQALALVALSLGLAFTALRKYASARD